MLAKLISVLLLSLLVTLAGLYMLAKTRKEQWGRIHLLASYAATGFGILVFIFGITACVLHAVHGKPHCGRGECPMMEHGMPPPPPCGPHGMHGGHGHGGCNQDMHMMDGCCKKGMMDDCCKGGMKEDCCKKSASTCAGHCSMNGSCSHDKNCGMNDGNCCSGHDAVKKEPETKPATK